MKTLSTLRKEYRREFIIIGVVFMCAFWWFHLFNISFEQSSRIPNGFPFIARRLLSVIHLLDDMFVLLIFILKLFAAGVRHPWNLAVENEKICGILVSLGNWQKNFNNNYAIAQPKWSQAELGWEAPVQVLRLQKLWSWKMSVIAHMRRISAKTKR